MSSTIILPKNVSFIINRLEENGFCAYAVGGCVRDILLSKKPVDWDICTNALPENIIPVFSDYKIVTNGIKHGTVTIIIDKIPYEVTTFRIDGNYLDNRHPDSVLFVDNLKEDLKRRDFTVNAMAYNNKTGIFDCFGGKEDLKDKIIRCVGEPDKRFGEDTLRIMRAIRFSAQLGFTVDKKTNISIFKNKDLLKNIAVERIQSEFAKICLSDDFNVYYKYREVFSVFTGNIAVDEDFCKIISKLPPSLPIRIAAFILNGLKTDLNDNTSEEAAAFLHNMKFDKKTASYVCALIKNYNILVNDDLKTIRKMLSEIDYDILCDIIILKKAFSKNENEHLLFDSILNIMAYIKNNNLCTKISELDINGYDLIEHNLSTGRKTGIILKKLLNEVIDGNVENNKEKLLEKAVEAAKDTEE